MERLFSEDFLKYRLRGDAKEWHEFDSDCFFSMKCDRLFISKKRNEM